MRYSILVALFVITLPMCRNSVFGHFDIVTESGDQLFKLPVVLRQAK
jgi:hypothetical protein